MTTRADTAVLSTEGGTGIDEKLERGTSSCHYSLGSRIKGPSSGVFQSPAAANPLGGTSAVKNPSAECGGEGSVASSRHDKSPEIPERGFQKRSLEGRRGFDIFPRVVGPGTLHPHHPPILMI